MDIAPKKPINNSVGNFKKKQDTTVPINATPIDILVNNR